MTPRPLSGTEPSQADPPPQETDNFNGWARYFDDFYPADSRLSKEFCLSRLLVLAGRSWKHRIDNILRIETGQTRARWQALFALAFAEQPATMSALCKRLRVQWPTLVRVIDGMARDGLVRKEDNPADGRSKLVTLTDQGIAVMERIQPILDRERAQILSRLSDAELDVCAGMLHRVFEDTINV